MWPTLVDERGVSMNAVLVVYERMVNAGTSDLSSRSVDLPIAEIKDRQDRIPD
jgi:hypothetical protein